MTSAADVKSRNVTTESFSRQSPATKITTGCRCSICHPVPCPPFLLVLVLCPLLVSDGYRARINSDTKIDKTKPENRCDYDIRHCQKTFGSLSELQLFGGRGVWYMWCSNRNPRGPQKPCISLCLDTAFLVLIVMLPRSTGMPGGIRRAKRVRSDVFRKFDISIHPNILYDIPTLLFSTLSARCPPCLA